MTPPHQRAFPGFQSLGPGQPERTVRFIAQLRDCLAEGRDARWKGEVVPPLDPWLLRHLPPPERPGPDSREFPGLREWRANYRAGRCYYRQGPGFVQIKDVREPGRFATVNLTEDAMMGTFVRCLRPMLASDLDQHAREAVRALTAKRLVLQLEGYVVTLPHRMRHWPVPANIV